MLSCHRGQGGSCVCVPLGFMRLMSQTPPFLGWLNLDPCIRPQVRQALTFNRCKMYRWIANGCGVVGSNLMPVLKDPGENRAVTRR